MKLKLDTSLSFFIPFSMFFLTMILPLSPFHFGLFFSLIIILSIIILKPGVPFFLYSKNDKGVILCVCSLVLLILLHILFPNEEVKELSITTPIMMIISFNCFLFSFYIRKMSSIIVKKTLSLFKNFTLVLLIIECFYRFTHVIPQSSYFNFYEYKFGSFMYSDTNYVGILVAFYIGFLFYLWKRRIIYISKIEIIVSCILCILTFSRAAIIGVFSLLFYWFIYKKMTSNLKLLSLSFFSLIIPIFVLLLINDESFVTKLDLYIQTWKYLFTIDSWHLIFGNGIGSSTLFLSRYGHTVLTLYLIEEGVLGVLILSVFITLNIIRVNHTLFLMIPFILIGFSYMANIIPYFYLLLGIIYNIELYRKDLFNNSNLKLFGGRNTIFYYLLKNKNIK